MTSDGFAGTSLPHKLARHVHQLDIVVAPSGAGGRVRMLVVVSSSKLHAQGHCLAVSLRRADTADGTWPPSVLIPVAPRNGLSADHVVRPGTLRRLRIANDFRVIGQITTAELAHLRAAIDLILTPDADRKPRVTRADLARALLPYRRP